MTRRLSIDAVVFTFVTIAALIGFAADTLRVLLGMS